MTRTSFPVDARTAEMIHSGSFEAETDTSELSKKTCHRSSAAQNSWWMAAVTFDSDSWPNRRWVALKPFFLKKNLTRLSCQNHVVDIQSAGPIFKKKTAARWRWLTNLQTTSWTE